jgi:hypothetical protein
MLHQNWLRQHLTNPTKEATGQQHNNQPNKMGVIEQQEADMPAEGFNKSERAADERSGRQERQQRFFVAGCVVVCDIFYLFLVYMLGNCYVLAGGVKKELVFAGTQFLQKGIPGKLSLEKREHGKKFLFFSNLEVIPQDSWNWKAKKSNEKRKAQGVD